VTRLPALDGLRALAVVAVVVYHTWTGPAHGGGDVGVDVFFVLSGYLITSLLLAERERTGRIDLLAFYRRRALRLLPALGAGVLLGLVLALMAGTDMLGATAAQALAAVLYVANWWDIGHAPNLLSHTWSLSIEEQFYVLWPLLLWALLAVRGRRLALGVALALSVAMLAERVVVTGSPAYFRLDTRADALLIGCGTALLTSLGAFRAIRSATLERIAVVGGVTLFALIELIAKPADLPFEVPTVIALAAAAVLVGVAGAPQGATARLLSLRPLSWLGQRSYGVYLYHYPIWAGLVMPRLGADGPWVLVATGSLTLVAAALSYRYLERPFLRLKNRAARSEPAVLEPVAA
jgi:peptidoglycan/LPS O-acetylase OafA/YrhL